MAATTTNAPKPGRKAAFKAVRSLANTEASMDHAQEFFRQVRKQRNDRGAAILTATNTENGLRYALARRLTIGADSYNDLFGLNGPMGTFDLKIRMGYLLKIFGQETRGNLDIIRVIRNAFAHTAVPITFKTPEIKKLCEFLKIPFVLPPKSIRLKDGKIIPPTPPKTARGRFNTVCETLAHNLLMYGARCPQKPRQHQDFDRYDVWLAPPPLP
jgi:hypothetical protein